MVISEYYRDDGAKANVVLRVDYYNIEFYNANGDIEEVESFKGKTLAYVEEAAENWVAGIKKNGV